MSRKEHLCRLTGISETAQPLWWVVEPDGVLGVFDQFTDSRVDDLYLSQLRLQLADPLSRRCQVGVIYTEPTNRDGVDLLVSAFSFIEPGTIGQSQSVNGYVAGRAGQVQWSALAGFREDPDTLTLAGTLLRPRSPTRHRSSPAQL